MNASVKTEFLGLKKELLLFKSNFFIKAWLPHLTAFYIPNPFLLHLPTLDLFIYVFCYFSSFNKNTSSYIVKIERYQ